MRILLSSFECTSEILKCCFVVPNLESLDDENEIKKWFDFASLRKSSLDDAHKFISRNGFVVLIEDESEEHSGLNSEESVGDEIFHNPLKILSIDIFLVDEITSAQNFNFESFPDIDAIIFSIFNSYGEDFSEFIIKLGFICCIKIEISGRNISFSLGLFFSLEVFEFAFLFTEECMFIH